MKEIPLYRCGVRVAVSLVDDADFERLEGRRWSLHQDGYAYRQIAPLGGPGKHIWMHREVIDCPPDLVTDHINGNRLDNRRNNLRAVSRHQNVLNSKVRRQSSTGIKGVQRVVNRWIATISFKGVRHHLGYFPTAYQAAEAYNRAALDLHGKFARLNDLDVIGRRPEFTTVVPRHQAERPSPYPGVWWDGRLKCWRVGARRHDRMLHVGRFKDLQEAVGAAESIEEFFD